MPVAMGMSWNELAHILGTYRPNLAIRTSDDGEMNQMTLDSLSCRIRNSYPGGIYTQLRTRCDVLVIQN